MQKAPDLDKSQHKYQENLTSSGKLDSNVYQLKKEVVLFVLKQSLLESGTKSFEMVTRSLFEKYRCDISDCFEKPEYLSDVLKYVYDGSYMTFVESIRKKLDKFSKESGIKEFLEKIGLE